MKMGALGAIGPPHHKGATARRTSECGVDCGFKFYFLEILTNSNAKSIDFFGQLMVSLDVKSDLEQDLIHVKFLYL